ADGKASIVEQFNAPDASAEIHTALLNRDADQKLRVTLIDIAQQALRPHRRSRWRLPQPA
ncbi:MAG: hypothetical protein ACKO8Z_14775, partial [Prosthecobacter sp.]